MNKDPIRAFHEAARWCFEARVTDPLKQWKLSPVDRASPDKWNEYTEAKEAMFFYTDTAAAPWTVVKSSNKKRARLSCMPHFLLALAFPNKDCAIVASLDPLIVGTTEHVISRDRHIIGETGRAGQFAAKAKSMVKIEAEDPNYLAGQVVELLRTQYLEISVNRRT